MSVADNIAFREFDRALLAIGGWWLNPRGVPRRCRKQDRALQDDQDANPGYADFVFVRR
jgi:hypothetical protein